VQRSRSIRNWQMVGFSFFLCSPAVSPLRWKGVKLGINMTSVWPWFNNYPIVAVDCLHCSKLHEGFRKVLQMDSTIFLTFNSQGNSCWWLFGLEVLCWPCRDLLLYNDGISILRERVQEQLLIMLEKTAIENSIYK